MLSPLPRFYCEDQEPDTFRDPPMLERKRRTNLILINKTSLPLLNPSLLRWSRRDTKFCWIYMFHLSFTRTRRKACNH